MDLLKLSDICVARGTRRVIDGVSLTIRPGEFVGLIGPNGAGKTTLMRAALGLLPHQGQSSLEAMTAEARARHAAWLPQNREIAWPVSVETLVRLGRAPHRLARDKAADDRAVESALERMALHPLRDRPATALSGGEQARVLIARALAQEAALLLADEATAGLDPAHQLAAMEIFAELAREGRSVLAAMHDLGLAARACTRLLLMHGGRIVADGTPADVLGADRLAEVFGIRAHYSDTVDGPVFQPLARLDAEVGRRAAAAAAAAGR